jgi:hypothetical protein
VDEIYVNGNKYGYNKNAHGDNIYQTGIDIISCYFINDVFYERIGKISLPEFFFYAPVPVSEKTVAPSVPDTEHEPGSKCETDNNKMGLTCLLPDPSEKIERNDQEMNNSKKSIHWCQKDGENINKQRAGENSCHVDIFLYGSK